MLACLQSAAVLGVDAYLVSVEVDVSFGLPQFSMVGLPDVTVRESRDRVRAAIRNSGFEFPPHRITVNLAPADLRKAGSSFDLSIAIGLLAAGGVVTRRAIDDTIILGELSLDGGINAVRGVLPVAAAARRLGVARVLLPPQNVVEACVIDGLGVCAVRSLQEAVEALNAPEAALLVAHGQPAQPRGDEPDLSEVRGQIVARRAIEVAAAGGHNLLMTGPPGSGKTMLARRLASVLPDMTLDEAIESTQIHSVAGQLPPGVGLLATRPFRAPHHTVSNVALVGGGGIPRPGEISLAHQGVLFLDELPEFDRRVLDALRQPIEEGRVAIARAAAHVVFPSRFMLVAAMNPCPCGYAGSERHTCRCTPAQVGAYASRVSGPLRDRFDLSIAVPQVPVEALSEGVAAESSAVVRARVVRAREVQRERAAGTPAVTNALLRGPGLLRHCRPDARGAARLARAVEVFGLSARGYHRVMRVARTIADLEGATAVGDVHVSEALHFRGS